jgi:hypothetical protein
MICETNQSDKTDEKINTCKRWTTQAETQTHTLSLSLSVLRLSAPTVGTIIAITARPHKTSRVTVLCFVGLSFAIADGCFRL